MQRKTENIDDIYFQTSWNHPETLPLQTFLLNSQTNTCLFIIEPIACLGCFIDEIVHYAGVNLLNLRSSNPDITYWEWDQNICHSDPY